MSKVSFENYGRRAQSALTYTEKAGRHNFQRAGEALILDDVAAKLGLNVDDDLLEVGCGAGNLLIPLSFRVNSCVGIDHAGCIADLRRRFNDPRMSAIEGNFLDVPVDGRFSAILVYSVVHVLSNLDEVNRLIDKALALLRPGGRLLVGDVPNEDRMQRFLATPRGQEVTAEYRRLRALGATQAAGFEAVADASVVKFHDEDLTAIAARLRHGGYDAFVLPQSEALPFGYTREDLLVRATPDPAGT